MNAGRIHLRTRSHFQIAVYLTASRGSGHPVPATGFAG
ncbi:hypothetical protein DFR29_10322 [Tahibacter aquaticus]|uniref:Uncharacterized protein n=1 Tax=Tahibacter aquaticus TaxID=520092 RepID=A0A4R6Z4D3_9GAMM|nr:hypothetical protein DFR29_10322 [Tahibacter aquaticus]